MLISLLPSGPGFHPDQIGDGCQPNGTEPVDGPCSSLTMGLLMDELSVGSQALVRSQLVALW